MQTLTLQVDTATHALRLAKFLKTIPYIKSVVSDKYGKEDKPLTAADWVRPGRPATDEEIEQMLDECERGTGEYSIKEVFDNVKTQLKEWRKDKKLLFIM